MALFMYSSVTDRLDKLYVPGAYTTVNMYYLLIDAIGSFQTFMAFADFQSKTSSENVDNFSIQAMAIDGCVNTTLC